MCPAAPPSVNSISLIISFHQFLENKEVQGKRGPLTKRVSTEVNYDKGALQSLLNNILGSLSAPNFSKSP